MADIDIANPGASEAALHAALAALTVAAAQSGNLTVFTSVGGVTITTSNAANASYIQINPGVSSDVTGSSARFVGGLSSSSGGNATLAGADATTSGNGGKAIINPGIGAGADGDGGAAEMYLANGSGTGLHGDFIIYGLGDIYDPVIEFKNDGSLNILVGNISVPTVTPASATAAGKAGTITWDTNYLYVCTATDTWKRIALAAWP